MSEVKFKVVGRPEDIVPAGWSPPAVTIWPKRRGQRAHRPSGPFTPARWPDLNRKTSRKRAVFTVAIGPTSRAQEAVSGPLWRRLADRWEADYLALTARAKDQPKEVPGTWEKLRACQLLERYDQVVLVDVDTVPHPAAPNLFELVDPSRLGVMLEPPGTGVFAPGGWGLFADEYAAIARSQGWGAPAPFQRFNSGLVVFGRASARVCDTAGRPVDTGPKNWRHTIEESLLNINARRLRLPLHLLSWEWNTLAFHRPEWEASTGRLFRDGPSAPGWVYHPGGLADRVDVMKRLRAALYPDERFADAGGEPRSMAATVGRTPPDDGPGTDLKRLLAAFGGSDTAGCGCKAMEDQMNRWGVAGCRVPANRDRIVGLLRANVAEALKVPNGSVVAGWLTWGKAALVAVRQGVAFTISASDPAPGLVDEAVRRAEARGLK